MGMRKASKQKELEGVVFVYEDAGFRVSLARAGGHNKQYMRFLEESIRPYRRQQETNTLKNEKVLPLIQEAYARHIIKNWEVERPDTKQPGESKWIVGIDNPDSHFDPPDILPFNVANVLKVISDDRFHDYYEDFVRMANEVSAYLEDKRAEETKNSATS